MNDDTIEAEGDSAARARAFYEHALADPRGVGRWPISRVAMYSALENLARDQDDPDKQCLCLSKSAPLADVIGAKKARRVVTSYPEVNMLALPYGDDTYDFTVSDQVLEHVAGDPFKAVAESVRVTKPGGLIVHTTCFMNFRHDFDKETGEGDYWRFTPAALAMMMRAGGIPKMLKCGGWGNRAAWHYMNMQFDKKTKFRDLKIPEVPGNPLYEMATTTHPRWLLHVWVAGRKPANG